MHEAYLQTLLAEVQSRGFSGDQVARAAADARDTTTGLGRALVHALGLTGDPGLALSFGLRLNLASHGILGYALMSSRNGDQLMTLLTRYAELAVPGLSLRRVVDGERLFLVCEAQAGELSREFLTDLVLSTLVSGARGLFNRRIPGAEVWLDYAPPAHVERYTEFGVPVRFSERFCALVCARSFLTMPLSSANPLMAEFGTRQCDELLQQLRQRSAFAERVRRAFLLAPGEFPSQEEMAQRLHVSARTLRRKLREEMTNYRELVDEVRLGLAKRYLRTPELRVSEIASLLGYDEVANFRRAFKRWTGQSPMTWRSSACKQYEGPCSEA